MKNIDGKALARMICLAVALINQTLAMIGKPLIDVSDDVINAFITNGFTFVMAIINCWKNNPITPEAKEGQKVIDELKRRKKELRG